MDAAEVGQRRRVGEAGAVDVVAAVCVAVAGRFGFAQVPQRYSFDNDIEMRI